MIKQEYNFKKDKLIFCNFLLDGSNSELPTYLECEIDKEYSKYDMNSIQGRINRMIYAAKENVLYAQLGNTTTYIYQNTTTKEILGLSYSVTELLDCLEENETFEQSANDWKDSLGYNDKKYENENWHSDWKKGIDKTVEVAKELNEGKFEFKGRISNSMWRIMAIQESNMEKHNVFAESLDNTCEIDIEEGKYILETDYHEFNPIFFKLKQIKE